MKALQSFLAFASLTGLLAFNTACNPTEMYIGATLGSEALMCAAWCRSAPPPTVIVVPPPAIYVAPVYVPAPVFIPVPVIRPGFRPCTPGPFGCISLNDKELSPTDIVAMGDQNYGIGEQAMKTLVDSLVAVQNGDLQFAARNIGLNSNMLKEAQKGEISAASTTQIANAIGASKESVGAFVGDLNERLKAKKLLEPNFDKCDTCG